jgi:ribonuclease HI
LQSDEKRPSVTIFTDGACRQNPGPGGWGVILFDPISKKRKELSGGEHATTNNRMEIMAVIKGLEALKKPSKVQLVSDSQYVINGITEWMKKWKAFGWRKTVNAKAQIRNVDLWQRLDSILRVHQVTTEWTRGHNGHPENERCDQLAEAEAVKFAALAPPPEMPTPALPDDGSLFSHNPAVASDK